MSIDLGFKGAELQPGEHLCALYSGIRQRDEDPLAVPSSRL